MKTYVIANQKGGVGKTTTSIALTQLLSRKGKVLSIDLDPQGNFTKALGGDRKSKIGAFEVLTQKANVAEAIEVINDKIHLLPGTLNLANFEREQMDAGIHYRLLKLVIEPLSVLEYDYVIIDTPPALGLLNTLALTTCTNGGIIIPAFADEFSLDGINELWDTIKIAKQYTNPHLKVLGILLTRHNSRTALSKMYHENIEDAAKKMDTKIFHTKIRQCVALSEAASLKKDLIEYAGPKSHAVIDYQNFLEELLNIDKGAKNHEQIK